VTTAQSAPAAAAERSAAVPGNRVAAAAERASAPLIGVLALQGDVREHVAILRGQGAEAVAVRRPEELAAVDGLVIPGGESTTMVKLAARYDVLEPLRAALRNGLPAYGSCAGMIMLADRLLDAPPDQETVGGLDMTVRRNAFGRQVASFEGLVPICGVAGGPVDALFIRAPWVEEVGPDVEVLGRVVDGPAAGKIVAVRQGRLMATSFHPELTGDTRVHALFVDLVRAARAQDAGSDGAVAGVGSEGGQP
jgi:5'-phosphate synthase pdxT subunit